MSRLSRICFGAPLRAAGECQARQGLQAMRSRSGGDRQVTKGRWRRCVPKQRRLDSFPILKGEGRSMTDVPKNAARQSGEPEVYSRREVMQGAGSAVTLGLLASVFGAALPEGVRAAGSAKDVHCMTI